MTEHTKLVDFHKYCRECKHWTKKETEEPCDKCLENPVNDNSHRPVCYEMADRLKKKV